MFFFNILLLFINVITSQNFNYQEGDWFILKKAGAINAIAETPYIVLFGTNNGIYTQDKFTEAIEYSYDLSKELSSNKIYHIIYNQYTDFYWVVHENGISFKSSISRYWREISFFSLNLSNHTDIDRIGYTRDAIWIKYGYQNIPLDPFNGSIIDPIKITSLDQKGGGLVIMGPKIESIFMNTIFEHLTSPNIGSSGLTASITIYDTEASFKKCIFDQNQSEDFLNLIHSRYEISDSYFKSAQSDAFDSDYSNGKIINSKFANIGNDAIDFSGSIAELSDLSFDVVGDKVLSAGEMSKISGNNIDIINTEIGITSKDLSEVSLTDLKIKDTRLGFAVFQKKEEYGASQAAINGLEMTNVDFVHLVDLNSTLTLNGKDVISKQSNVEDLLYGVNFGKSSK